MNILKEKKTFFVYCFLLAFLLSACGKGKAPVGESTEATVETKKEEPVSEATQAQQVTAEDLIPTDYAATMIVTINPQVKLYLDSNHIIVGIEYLNEDARIAYAGIDFFGKSVEEGMEQLVDAAAEKEFLINGKEVSIDVAEVRDENYDYTAACAKAEEAIAEATKNCRIEAVISAKVSAPEAEESEKQDTQPSSQSQTATQTTSQPKPQEKQAEETQGEAETAQEEAPIEEAQEAANACSNCGGTGNCDECKGDGKLGSGFKVSCPRCHGKLTETCIYCDAGGNSIKHEGRCDFPNCMGAHVYPCTTCGGGSTPVTCASCNGSGKCKVCGGSGTQ